MRKGRWDCSRWLARCDVSELPETRTSVAPASAQSGQDALRLSVVLSVLSSSACTADDTGKVCQPLRRVSTVFSARRMSSWGRDGRPLARRRCWKSRIVTLARLRLVLAKRRKSQTLACSTRDRSPASLERTKFTTPWDSPERQRQKERVRTISTHNYGIRLVSCRASVSMSYRKLWSLIGWHELLNIV